MDTKKILLIFFINLLTENKNRCIICKNKPQRRSSHVYEQVLLLLCYGLPDFCEIREVRSGFRNNKIRTVRIRRAVGA